MKRYWLIKFLDGNSDEYFQGLILDYIDNNNHKLIDRFIPLTKGEFVKGALYV